MVVCLFMKKCSPDLDKSTNIKGYFDKSKLCQTKTIETVFFSKMCISFQRSDSFPHLPKSGAQRLICVNFTNIHFFLKKSQYYTLDEGR